MGGGILKKGVHPPAKKFNAGQKIIFWATMIGGLSINMSGIALMLFEREYFGETHCVAQQRYGFSLPTDLTPLQGNNILIVARDVLAMLVSMIIAHIYIGSVGMEGAIDAMHTGEVDLNWAKEHHNLWVEEEQQKAGTRRHPLDRASCRLVMSVLSKGNPGLFSWLVSACFTACVVAVCLLPLSARAMQTYTAHGGPVKGLAIAPDSSAMVSASFDYTAVVWSTDQIAPQATLYYEAAVNVAAFSPDSAMLATARDKWADPFMEHG